MTIAGVIAFLGWTFVLVPLAVFLFISFQMIKGAAGDDPLILGLSMLGITIFLMGAVALLLLYLTDIFAAFV